MFIYDNTIVIDGSFPVPLFYCPWLDTEHEFLCLYLTWYFYLIRLVFHSFHITSLFRFNMAISPWGCSQRSFDPIYPQKRAHVHVDTLSRFPLNARFFVWQYELVHNWESHVYNSHQMYGMCLPTSLFKNMHDVKICRHRHMLWC